MIQLFAITGYKLSGKTTVGNVFRKNNIPMVDIDDMYCDMLKPGSFAHKELIYYFGNDIIQNNGFIDIKKLSVLSCNELWIKDFVDDIVEKEIGNFLELMISIFDKYRLDFAGIEVGIINNKIIEKINNIIFVNCPIKDRQERLNKYYNPNIVNNLLSYEKEVEQYDYKIDNCSTIEDLEKTSMEVLIKLLDK